MENFASLDTHGSSGGVKVVEWNQNQLIRSLCWCPRCPWFHPFPCSPRCAQYWWNKQHSNPCKILSDGVLIGWMVQWLGVIMLFLISLYRTHIIKSVSGQAPQSHRRPRCPRCLRCPTHLVRPEDEWSSVSCWQEGLWKTYLNKDCWRSPSTGEIVSTWVLHYEKVVHCKWKKDD